MNINQKSKSNQCWQPVHDYVGPVFMLRFVSAKENQYAHISKKSLTVTISEKSRQEQGILPESRKYECNAECYRHFYERSISGTKINN